MAWVVSVVWWSVPSQVGAAQLTLTWEANRTSLTAGYVLYDGYDRGNYRVGRGVGMPTTYTLSDLEDRVAYHGAVTAYHDEGNESRLSSKWMHEASAPDQEGETREASTPDSDEALLEPQESDQAGDFFSPPLEVVLSPYDPLAIVSAEAEQEAATEADERVEVASAQVFTPAPLLESLRRADTRRLLMRLRTRLKARAQIKGAEDGLLQNP
ncbi:MAG: hypothetical protein ACREOH_03130 [Candidatus Entotheonellia bacterium]